MLYYPYIHFTFPQTSKCFISNGTKNMHILASGPELQQLDLGMSFLAKIDKEERILKLTSCAESPLGKNKMAGVN